MSAWSKDLSTAPQDRQVLARHPDWEAPVVVQWDEEAGFFLFSEPLLQETDNGIAGDYQEYEWADIPT